MNKRKCEKFAKHCYEPWFQIARDAGKGSFIEYGHTNNLSVCGQT